MSIYQAERVKVKQAIALAILVLDFEIESPQVEQPPESWMREIKEARQVLTNLLHQKKPYTEQTVF